MKIISIIIPIYNVEKYLDECLKSIVGFDDIEIILVNDCTPDNSIIIAESYINKYNNIKLIHHSKNKGLGETRNTGIKHSTGKYIFFLDSDDYLDRKKLPTLLDILKQSDHEQVLISFIRFNEKKGTWPLQYENFYTKNNEKVLNHRNFKALVTVINLSQIRILKREKILSDNIWFPIGLYEDVLWSYWFAYSCKSTLVLDNRIYFYRQHSNSILGSTSRRHTELIEQHNRTMELFKSKNIPLEIISVLEHRFITHTKHVLFKTERLPLDVREKFSKDMIENMETFLLEKEKKVKQLNKDLLKKSKKIERLDTAFKIMSSIRFRYNPVKKVKAYKELMKTYYSLKGK